MINGPSTAKIYIYNVLTLGLYALFWSARSRRDIQKSAKTTLIPSPWLLIVPAGGYWWYWRYAEALEAVSFGRLSRSETYLLFILATHIPVVAVSYLNFIPTPEVKNDDFGPLLLYCGILFVVLYITFTIAMAFFMATMQKRIRNIQPQHHLDSPIR